MEITLNDISSRIKEIADERGYTPYAVAERVPQPCMRMIFFPDLLSSQHNQIPFSAGLSGLDRGLRLRQWAFPRRRWQSCFM